MSDRPTLWRITDNPTPGDMRRATRSDLLAALGFEKVKERFCAVHGAVYYFKGSVICGMHQVLISAGKDVSRTCVPTTVWMEAADG